MNVYEYLKHKIFIIRKIYRYYNDLQNVCNILI